MRKSSCNIYYIQEHFSIQNIVMSQLINLPWAAPTFAPYSILGVRKLRPFGYGGVNYCCWKPKHPDLIWTISTTHSSSKDRFPPHKVCLLTKATVYWHLKCWLTKACHIDSWNLGANIQGITSTGISQLHLQRWLNREARQATELFIASASNSQRRGLFSLAPRY